MDERGRSMGLSYTTISSQTANPGDHTQRPGIYPQNQPQQATRDPHAYTANRLDQRDLGTTKGTATPDRDIVMCSVFEWLTDRGSSDSSAGWKPYTMRAPVLCAVIIISLGLAGVIEYLAQTSQRQGGLALSLSENDIPQTVNIAYLYMPTTVAVLYSLLWTWIDLDVRRMQPWFELSRPGGARGDQSLLLNYPFEFLAFVPISAWKQRHWPVFNAGLVMMLVFWTITPLQGAIFGKQAVDLTRSAAMSISSGLIPVEDQAAIFDVSILNAAYGSTWYDQDLPEYTTAEYALLPFYPVDLSTSGTNESWTFNSTRFKTDLDCWSANMKVNTKDIINGKYQFDNGQGCSQNLSWTGDTEGSYGIQYIGFEGSAYLDWSLHNTYCGDEFSHQFIAVVGQGTGTGGNATFGNITAMFCEPSYMQQEVSITVDAATGQPSNDSLVELAPWTQLDDTAFNSSAFEFLLHAGFSSITIDRDYPDNLILDQYAKMYDLNIGWPVTNMVGFAIGLHDGPLADFLNTTVLHETYAAAHKLIFSSAFSQLVPKTQETGKGKGLVKYTMYGIVISRTFSIIVESLLIVVAILGAFLFYTITKSQSNLSSDPDSIASMLKMAQKDEVMLTHISKMANLSETSLHARMSSDRYTLKGSASGPTLHLISSGQDGNASNDSDPPRTKVSHVRVFFSKKDGNTSNGLEPITTTVSQTELRSIRPKELRPMVGVLLVLILSAAIGVLGYLKHEEMRLNGKFCIDPTRIHRTMSSTVMDT